MPELIQSLEIERHVLGSVLRDNDQYDAVAEQVTVDDFAAPTHRKTWAIFGELHRDGKPIDLVSITEHIGVSTLDDIGGMSALTELYEAVPVATELGYYVGLLRSRTLRRKLAKTAQDLAELSADHSIDTDAAIDEAERRVLAIRESQLRGAVGIDKLVEQSITRMLAAQKGQGIEGVPTGFTDIDDLLGGMQRGDLIILAGRPAMGKSSLALNIAEHAAHSGGVAFYSLEMGKDSLMDRMLLGGAGVTTDQLRKGLISQADSDAVYKRVNEIFQLPIVFDDRGDTTASKVRASARRYARALAADDKQLSLIVVDYLQLMIPEKRNDRRDLEVSDTTRSLKRLARELDVPVLLLSQLNRMAEHRKDKRPMLSDLRESGAIEQDADVVMFLYRHHEYDSRHDSADTELLIRKHRNGATGKLRLRFNDRLTKFENRRFEDRSYEI